MMGEILLFVVVGITPIIVLFLIALYAKFVIGRAKNEQKKEEDLRVTKKIAEKILLNNRWGSVDDKIAILRNNSIILNFRLGIHDEEKDI